MYTNCPPAPPTRGPLRRLALWFLMPFMLLALVKPAQAATDLIANNTTLPLRNVLIEVRQVQQTQTQNGGVQIGAAVIAGRAVAGQAHVQARQTQNQREGTTSQQVLVLNGYRARVAVSTQVPLRVLQTYVRNGALVAVPGTLVLEAGTGFAATPRWDGSSVVALEISAAQSLGGAQAPLADATTAQTAQTRSVLAVPLDTWVTVAESDAQSRGASSSLGGQAQWTEQASSAVQVRLTLH